MVPTALCSSSSPTRIHPILLLALGARLPLLLPHLLAGRGRQEELVVQLVRWVPTLLPLHVVVWVRRKTLCPRQRPVTSTKPSSVWTNSGCDLAILCNIALLLTNASEQLLKNSEQRLHAQRKNYQTSAHFAPHRRFPNLLT